MKRKIVLVALNILLNITAVLCQDGTRCGKTTDSNTIDHFLITNATSQPDKSPVGNWPWMASIGYYDGDNKWQHQCGATLISDRHFLTAAHCVNLEWKIRIGDSNQSSDQDDGNVKVFEIVKEKVHPLYNGVSVYYDVAVLETDEIPISRSISPICLPESVSSDVNKYDNDLAELIVWRKSQTDGNLSDLLERVYVKVFSQRECNFTHMHSSLSLKEIIKKKLPDLFLNHILCAGTLFGGQGVCKGDSGGPLMFHNREENRWIQFAMVQGAVRDCEDIDYPAIYIRLDDDAILPFIHDTLDNQNKISTTTKPPSAEAIVAELEEEPSTEQTEIVTEVSHTRPQFAKPLDLVVEGCHDLLTNGSSYTNGVYNLQIGPDLKEVFCDMETLGGGWTVIQRRGIFPTGENPPDYFLRNWTEYQNGFGAANNELWLGLDSIFMLTNTEPMQLLITLDDWEGNRVGLYVNEFRISNAIGEYRILYSNFSSALGMSLPPIGTKFSTFDKDNDGWEKNCAEKFSGAWWYSACHNSNLNGLYLRGEHESFGDGVNWYHWKSYHYSLKNTVMKIRPQRMAPTTTPPPSRTPTPEQFTTTTSPPSTTSTTTDLPDQS